MLARPGSMGDDGAAMPSVDVPRATLRLTDAELAVAVTALRDPADPALGQPRARATLASLADVGMGEGGRLTGVGGRGRAVVAAPRLRLLLERFGGGEVRLDQVWATERAAV